MRRSRMFSRPLAVVFSAWPVAAAAAGTPQAVSLDQLGQVGLGLIAVLAVFGVCVMLLKRLPMMRTRQGANLRIIEGIALGARDRVLLLQVEQTRLLLGVSPGRIECLHVMGDATGFKSQLAAASSAIHAGAEISDAVAAPRN